jgi:hypothetical protein
MIRQNDLIDWFYISFSNAALKKLIAARPIRVLGTIQIKRFPVVRTDTGSYLHYNLSKHWRRHSSLARQRAGTLK